MEVMLMTIIVFLLVCCYMLLQLYRNNLVLCIRINWIDNDDLRWRKYTYREMIIPSKHNWYGLKIPKDSHFK